MVVGHVKATALKHDRNGRINPMHFLVPGGTANIRVFFLEGDISFKGLSANGTGKFIKWHFKTPVIRCITINK
jgi:hypothetical protein